MKATRPSAWFSRVRLSLNGDAGHVLLLFGLCLLLVVPELGGDTLRNALRYERAAVGGGEWWRLVTAHVVHLDLRHALFNMLGLVLMWVLFARDFALGRWIAVIGLSMATVDAGLWFCDRSIQWYVGASGVLHGVMVAGTVAHLRRRDRNGWLLAGFVLVKLAWEQLDGALPLALPADEVVVSAHLYGAVGGLLAGLGLRSRREPL